MTEIYDFVKEKEKREAIAQVDKLYAEADRVYEENEDSINEVMKKMEAYTNLGYAFDNDFALHIDSDGHVVFYDAEGNKYIHKK
jgi:hypothetical protein